MTDWLLLQADECSPEPQRQTVSTHKNRCARQHRKELGNWDAPHATELWQMKDGRRIRLREMSDGHLENTLKLLVRAAVVGQARNDIGWIYGPRPNGDMASLASDQACAEEAQKTYEDYVTDIYWFMVEEYEFRGHSMEKIRKYGHQRALAVLATILRGKNENNSG